MNQAPTKSMGTPRRRISGRRLALSLTVCVGIGTFVGLMLVAFPIYFADSFHGLPPAKVTWSEWRPISDRQELVRYGHLLEPERFTEIRGGQFETWGYTFEIHQVREAGNLATEQYIPFRCKATLKVVPVVLVYVGLAILLVLGILWSRRPVEEPRQM